MPVGEAVVVLIVIVFLFTAKLGSIAPGTGSLLVTVYRVI